MPLQQDGAALIISRVFCAASRGTIKLKVITNTLHLPKQQNFFYVCGEAVRS